MEKVWLKHYPNGVPADINPNQYSSIADLFRRSAKQFGALPAFSNLGKTLNYSETDRLTRQFAAYLTQEAQLKPGDRIAIMMPNLLQYPIALFGALRAGLVVVNTNPLYTANELEHQLKDSGAKAIIIVENFAHVLEKVVARTQVKTIITTEVGDLVGGFKSLLINFVVRYIKKMVPPFSLPQAVKLKQALQMGSQHLTQYQDALVTNDDIAFLQYTGGTTGVAKGAVLTHRNMIANLLQASSWTAHYLQDGKETFITALPLYHVFALTANALFSVKIGAHNILITNPRDVPTFLKDLKRQPFTFMTGVNTLFNLLLNAKGIEEVDFSKLKVALGGGMAVQEAVAKRWKDLTGVVLLEAYGLTETSPAVCINPVDLKEYNGMIGLPLSSTEVSVHDLEGKELAIGEAGELWVRGPQVMREYWQRPSETAKVLTSEGWLKTGDVAIINEQGYVKLVDPSQRYGVGIGL